MARQQTTRDRRKLRLRDMTVRRRQLKRSDEQQFRRSVRPYLGR